MKKRNKINAPFYDISKYDICADKPLKSLIRK